MAHILIHPVYFGSIEYYYYLTQNKQHTFEIFDHFQKQTYRNRTYIATAQGKHLLYVPIKHVGIKNVNSHQILKEVQIAYEEDWQKVHWKTIQIAYRTSPFFEYYEDDLVEIFEKKHTYLVDLNFHTLEVICGLLGIDIPINTTQKYEAQPTEVIDLRNLTISKRESDLHFPEYTQVLQKHHGFIKNLSILDLLCNEGPQSINYLQKITITS